MFRQILSVGGFTLLSRMTGFVRDIVMAAIMGTQAAAIQEQRRFSRQNEQEADRIGLLNLEKAGYDPRAAVRFWTAFGQRAGRPLLQAGTHPGWQDRAASIEKEVRAIEAQRAAGQPLAPPLIGAPPPLE